MTIHPPPPTSAHSFVCPTEITAFSDRYDEFKALNTEVLGVSIDSQFSHLAWIQTGGPRRCPGRCSLAGVRRQCWLPGQPRRRARTTLPPPCAATALARVQPRPPADRKQGGVGDLKYPLVADLKREISEAYGVLAPDGVALRGLFIIDREGIVQHSTINNLAFGRNVDETLRVLQALQYVQAHPDEVCPAGWRPGEATMKPDPTGSKEYFAKI